MTPADLTESLTLALKLKAEVEQVCTLLDEKDARIAELEREKAEECRLFDALGEHDEEMTGDVKRAVRIAYDLTLDCQTAEEACSSLVEMVRRERDRIAALESELAAMTKHDGVCTNRELARQLTETRSELAAKGRECACHSCEVLPQLHEQVAEMCAHLGVDPAETPADSWTLRDAILRLEKDRDRERSRREATEAARDALEEALHAVVRRREALEREVRELETMVAACCVTTGTESDWSKGHITASSFVGARLRAILDCSAEQDSTAQCWGIYDTAQKRWWPRRFPTREAAEDHRAVCAPESLSEVRELPQAAEQDEPHTPDAEPECTGPNADWCPLHLRSVDIPSVAEEPEPRMSVSEAHLEKVVREARAVAFDEAASIAFANDPDSLLVAALQYRAVTVRRGEA